MAINTPVRGDLVIGQCLVYHSTCEDSKAKNINHGHYLCGRYARHTMDGGGVQEFTEQVHLHK